MYAMCKKVSAKERILGFYSTGPRIRPADIHIDALFRCVSSAPWAMRVRVRLDCAVADHVPALSSAVWTQ